MLTVQQVPQLLSQISQAESKNEGWTLRFDGTFAVDRAAGIRRAKPYNHLSLGLDLVRAAHMKVRLGIGHFPNGQQLAITDPQADNHTVYVNDVVDLADGLCHGLNKVMLNRLRLQVGLPKL